MSKAKTSSAQSPAPTPASDDGFIDETRPDIAGWIRPEPGLRIHGRIVGAFAFMAPQPGRGMKRRDVLCVRLLEECRIVVNKEPKVGNPGDVVGMSIVPATAELRYYVAGKAEFKVEYLRKEPMSGGGETWKARVQCKGKKATRPWYGSVQPRDEPVSTGGDDDGDIPF